ncbi:Arm DNA-binding domain-containing protein [Wohlfahrtiimonas populi]|uniref:Arm DNA-binding domain-containing protein n=1 Tax=Wohlfahrtiimonas populi TaxID=1940240 RepID=UPI001E6434D8|nr:Arm DNA-binding domain-containing protein [Wohlfahrtiimonas populi]
MARIIVPLTVKQVKDAKPQEKLYRLYDGNGLQLCIHPSGSKVWRFDYHDYNKKRKTYTIGDANLITLADARIKRDVLKLQLINGETIQTSSNHTYESVFMDWYERWKVNVSERHHTRAMNIWLLMYFLR